MSTLRILCNKTQMMIITWSLFLFTIPTIVELRELSKFDDFCGGDRIMKMILESCYDNESLSEPIVVFGDFNEFIDKSSVIRIDNFLNIDSNYGKHQLLNFKANKIVLIEDSPEKLKTNLILLRKTKLWNHMASFFIIGKKQSTCENFEEIFIKTWEMNVINSIFICWGLENTQGVYTFNPIANYAPYPWKRVEKLGGLNVFHQIFDPLNSCENLHYDKTKFLDGYKIRGIAIGSPDVNYEPGRNYSEDKNFDRFDIALFHSITKALNASFIIEIEAGGDPIMKRLTAGSSDMMINFEFLKWHMNASFLFPCYWTQLVAIVESNSYLSTLEKILALWSRPVLILAMISLTILFLVFIAKNRDISTAILEIIRFLTYVSIQTNSSKLSFRIYFSTMLIMIVISNGVFQGSIASFLTKEQKAKGPETIEELVDLKYKFHVPPGGGQGLKAECPKCDIAEVPAKVCIDYVLNKTLITCVAVKEYYEENYALLPVKYIEEPIAEIYLDHKCRDDWPLHDRINDVLMRIVESGLFSFWRMEVARYPMHKRRADEIEASMPQYRPVQLPKLDFAFELLGIGLLISTAVFIVELLVANLRSSIRSMIC